jgi:hypothetical protein
MLHPSHPNEGRLGFSNSGTVHTLYHYYKYVNGKTKNRLSAAERASFLSEALPEPALVRGEV